MTWLVHVALIDLVFSNDSLFDSRWHPFAALVDLDLDLGVTKTTRHNMKAHLYKHILEDVHVLLNPETFEVLCEAPHRLKDFLSHASMEELIELGIFRDSNQLDFNTCQVDL